MSLDTRDHSIIAQASAHDAAEVYAALVRAGVFTQWSAADFESIRQDICAYTHDTVRELTTTDEQTAVAAVVTAFPGTTVEPSPFPPLPGQQIAPQPVYVPPVPQPYVPAVQYPQPTYPQPGFTQPPPPPIPQAPPQNPNGCPKCGQRVYDNRADNARKRQMGYSLVPDIKCGNRSCDYKVWPDDYSAYANRPKEPRQ